MGYDDAPGYEDQKGSINCVKRKKSIYGLKQSPPGSTTLTLRRNIFTRKASALVHSIHAFSLNAIQYNHGSKSTATDHLSWLCGGYRFLIINDYALYLPSCLPAFSSVRAGEMRGGRMRRWGDGGGGMGSCYREHPEYCVRMESKDKSKK